MRGINQSLLDMLSSIADNSVASQITAALALSRELGVLPDEAWCNESIGGVEWKLNDRGEAKEYYHRALTLYNQLGDHESVQRVQSYLRRLGE